MNFQPYLFFPQGDGVRAPIRQTAIRNPSGLLPRDTSTRLYQRRKAAPNPFATAIRSLPQYGQVRASAFSQMGRGRWGSDSIPPPFFGGSMSDPLGLGKVMKGRGRAALQPLILSTRYYAPTFGGRRRKRGRALPVSRINPGSF